MRRWCAWAAVGAVVVIFALVGRPAPARPQGSELAAPAKPQAAALPVSHVILFSSGVGYFQREGEVNGNARVDLSFPITDINDLLKSMVIQDLDGGKVGVVNFDSVEPMEKTLRSFALDLTYNPTLGQLLNQARGEKVEVTTPPNASQPSTTGIIVGMEVQTHAVPGGMQATETEVLNLLTADGLHSIPLAQVQRVRFLNPTLDAELKRALEVLARSHDTQKKSVTLGFDGQGKRTVRVGYVVENPLWKTSYRLVLDKNKKPYLQGWAIVENTSDEDWSNVRMALVSGRPVSFEMDLYSSLFVPRPKVEPELFASLRPPTYDGDMLAQGGGGPAGGVPVGAVNRYQPGFAMGGAGIGGGGFGGGGGMGGGEAPKKQTFGENTDPGPARQRLSMEELKRRKKEAAGGTPDVKEQVKLELDHVRDVASAASAERLGDYFQYVIDNKVTLQRQKSAMLPIITKDVEATKVSIYNESVHPKYPLHGLRFKNTTGQALTQGPITVFDGNSYAGDARVLDLQPNEERLISYAIDLGVEVESSNANVADQMTALKIAKGMVHITSKSRESKTYVIKNRAAEDRTIIVEQPVRNDWKLVAPAKPTEQSRDVYRFQLAVPAGKTVSQVVAEEKTTYPEVVLLNADDRTIDVYLKSRVISPQVKAALEEALKLRARQADAQRQLATAEEQLKAIRQDQERLRANLREVPPTSAAYKRYLEKFDKQETEIEKLQEDSKRLKETAEQQRKEYETFVVGLNVE